MTNINYFIVGLVVLAAIILIIFLIRRNQKDEKKFETKINQPEMKPEKHHGDQTGV